MNRVAPPSSPCLLAPVLHREMKAFQIMENTLDEFKKSGKLKLDILKVVSQIITVALFASVVVAALFPFIFAVEPWKVWLSLGAIHLFVVLVVKSNLDKEISKRECEHRTANVFLSLKGGNPSLLFPDEGLSSFDERLQSDRMLKEERGPEVDHSVQNALDSGGLDQTMHAAKLRLASRYTNAQIATHEFYRNPQNDIAKAKKELLLKRRFVEYERAVKNIQKQAFSISRSLVDHVHGDSNVCDTAEELVKFCDDFVAEIHKFPEKKEQKLKVLETLYYKVTPKISLVMGDFIEKKKGSITNFFSELLRQINCTFKECDRLQNEIELLDQKGVQKFGAMVNKHYFKRPNIQSFKDDLEQLKKTLQPFNDPLNCYPHPLEEKVRFIHARYLSQVEYIFEKGALLKEELKNWLKRHPEEQLRVTRKKLAEMGEKIGPEQQEEYEKAMALQEKLDGKLQAWTTFDEKDLKEFLVEVGDVTTSMVKLYMIVTNTPTSCLGALWKDLKQVCAKRKPTVFMPLEEEIAYFLEFDKKVFPAIETLEPQPPSFCAVSQERERVLERIAERKRVDLFLHEFEQFEESAFRLLVDKIPANHSFSKFCEEREVILGQIKKSQGTDLLLAYFEKFTEVVLPLLHEYVPILSQRAAFLEDEEVKALIKKNRNDNLLLRMTGLRVRMEDMMENHPPHLNSLILNNLDRIDGNDYFAIAEERQKILDDQTLSYNERSRQLKELLNTFYDTSNLKKTRSPFSEKRMQLVSIHNEMREIDSSIMTTYRLSRFGIRWLALTVMMIVSSIFTSPWVGFGLTCGFIAFQGLEVLLERRITELEKKKRALKIEEKMILQNKTHYNLPKHIEEFRRAAALGVDLPKKTIATLVANEGTPSSIELSKNAKNHVIKHSF